MNWLVFNFENCFLVCGLKSRKLTFHGEKEREKSRQQIYNLHGMILCLPYSKSMAQNNSAAIAKVVLSHKQLRLVRYICVCNSMQRVRLLFMRQFWMNATILIAVPHLNVHILRLGFFLSFCVYFASFVFLLVPRRILYRSNYIQLESVSHFILYLLAYIDDDIRVMVREWNETNEWVSVITMRFVCNIILYHVVYCSEMTIWIPLLYSISFVGLPILNTWIAYTLKKKWKKIQTHKRVWERELGQIHNRKEITIPHATIFFFMNSSSIAETITESKCK